MSRSAGPDLSLLSSRANGALCRTQKRFRHDSRLAARSRLSDSFPLDAYTHAPHGAPRRRVRCVDHRNGYQYGEARRQSVTLCQKLQSGHRRHCELLRCCSTPQNRLQNSSKRPLSINRCEERLFIEDSQRLFNSVGASIGSTS